MKPVYKILFGFAAIALGACADSDDSKPPVATFTTTCVEFLCQFDASESKDNYGGGLVYSWDFGDNKTANNAREVRHPYTLSDSYNVTLNVTDANGKSASTAQVVTVQGDATANYYSYIHDSFSLLLLTHETLRAAYLEASGFQALAEAEGPTSSIISRDCTITGKIFLNEWNDTNTDGQVNNSESLKFSLDDCQFDAGRDVISTAGVATITGDVESPGFEFVTGDFVQFGMNIEPYADWGINGTLDFTTDNSGATLRFGYSGSDVKHVLKGTGLTVLATVSGTPAITADVNDLAGIAGSYSYRIGAVAINGTILDPLSFEKNTGAMQPNDISLSTDVVMLTGGRTSIKISSITIYISPDADPDYLKIEVDTDTDGDIDKSGRYLQTIAIEPLSNQN